MAINTDITTELVRIEQASEKIKDKSESLGLKKDNGETLDRDEDTLEDYAEAIENIETMSGKTVTLTSSSQTISCAEKYMTSDIIVPAANVYLTGTSTPDSSTGNDGDFYLVTD